MKIQFPVMKLRPVVPATDYLGPMPPMPHFHYSTVDVDMSEEACNRVVRMINEQCDIIVANTGLDPVFISVNKAGYEALICVASSAPIKYDGLTIVYDPAQTEQVKVLCSPRDEFLHEQELLQCRTP